MRASRPCFVFRVAVNLPTRLTIVLSGKGPLTLLRHNTRVPPSIGSRLTVERTEAPKTGNSNVKYQVDPIIRTAVRLK